MRRSAELAYKKQKQRNLLADAGVFECVIVLDHLKAGFNVAKIFRSAQAFGAHEIHLIDIGPFDPSPSKGAFKRVPAHFHDDFKTSYENLKERGYTLFTLEPDCGESVYDAEIPEKSAFIFGHEEHGISFNRADFPGVRCLRIPQYGQIESLNVSVAASVVLYEYTRRFHGQAQEYVLLHGVKVDGESKQ